MKVELHVASSLWPEAFDRRDVPIQLVFPDAPRCVRRFTMPFASEGAEAVIGRYAGPQPAGSHWPWTEPVPEEDENTDLSREQLRLRRRSGRWELSVPGHRRYDKPDAVIQYWGSSSRQDLHCGGAPLVLPPSAHVSAVVRTREAFYWALFAVPAEKGRVTAPEPRRMGGSPTTPAPDPANDPNRFPTGWQQAVAIKYQPYLSWPMGWQPALVQPRHYPPPPADHHPGEPLDVRRKLWAESIKRRLGDLRSAAVRRGMPTSTPRAIDLVLLDWLVSNGSLRLDRHRCEWLPLSEPSDDS
jgi:hypothetical protein